MTGLSAAVLAVALVSNGPANAGPAAPRGEVSQSDAATVYFSDDFESGLGKWDVSGLDWALIATDCRGGGGCITDSPEGNYPANANSTVTMRRALDLSGATAPVLSFWHKYALNSAYYGGRTHYDHGYVEVSRDGGLTWEAVTGGDYTGRVSTWTLQRVDLSAYKEASILLRFRLRDEAEVSGQADGWSLDDIAIGERDAQRTPFPFFDNFESGLGRWDVSGRDWALTETDYRSAGHAITDSPEGNYPANANTTVTLAHPLDLSGATAPTLSFWHKYALNSAYYGGRTHYDHGYVEVSRDGGLTWEAVTGGDYTGRVSTWTLQRVDLSAYKEASILLRFRLRDDARTGQADGWSLDDISVAEQDTLRTPFPFFDNFEAGLGRWDVSGRDWALTETDYRSAGHAITDSPEGNYPANADSTVTLTHPLDLSGATAPVLSFWHKFGIVPDSFNGYYDYGYVEVSVNGGLTWTQPAGVRFTGSASTWTLYRVDLTPYKGPSVLVRFRLRDDARTGQADGWSLDDISAYDNADLVPPETTITEHPADPSTSDQATFSFTSSELLSTFECALNAGVYTPCTSPKTYAELAAGPHTFRVRATDFVGNVDLTPASFTWQVGSPAVTLTAIAPTTGPTAGGTVVTLTGTGFAAGATVTLGGVAATNVTVVNATTITAVTPAHAAGAVEVVVTNPDTQAGTRAGGFTYVAPAPTVTSLAPTTGPTEGGTVVTLTGTGFAAGAAVTLGGVAATNVTVVNATTITAVTPAHAAGAVDVVVTMSGVTPATLASGFTYVETPPVPSLTGFSPNSGPAGTPVTLTGTGFTRTTDVSFDGVSASFTVDSDTQITTNVPQGSTTGSIRVTTPGGTATSSTLFTVTEHRVVRSAPVCYAPGYPVVVTIDLRPAATVLSHAVQEAVPQGWSVGAISHEGAWVTDTQTVRWGLFLDDTPRVLTYEMTPPSAANAPTPLTGVASFNGVDLTIEGLATLGPCERHPADTNDDDRLVIGEVTAYGAAWKRGGAWPTPPTTIPIAFVTRAGYLWRSGESYERGVEACPLCWVALPARPLPDVSIMVEDVPGQRHTLTWQPPVP